jgi:hypothetical protein
LMEFCRRPWCSNFNCGIDFDLLQCGLVQLLPREFNDDALFKLLPSPTLRVEASISPPGMDRRYGGHIWTITKTTNILNNNDVCFLYLHVWVPYSLHPPLRCRWSCCVIHKSLLSMKFGFCLGIMYEE